MTISFLMLELCTMLSVFIIKRTETGGGGERPKLIFFGPTFVSLIPTFFTFNPWQSLGTIEFQFNISVNVSIILEYTMLANIYCGRNIRCMFTVCIYKEEMKQKKSHFRCVTKWVNGILIKPYIKNWPNRKIKLRLLIWR